MPTKSEKIGRGEGLRHQHRMGVHVGGHRPPAQGPQETLFEVGQVVGPVPHVFVVTGFKPLSMVVQNGLHGRPRRLVLLPDATAKGSAELLVLEHQSLPLNNGVGVRLQRVGDQGTHGFEFLCSALKGIGQKL